MDSMALTRWLSVHSLEAQGFAETSRRLLKMRFTDKSAVVTGQCMVSCDGGSLSRVAIWFQQDHVRAAGLQS
jgi:hypothetical protein